MTVVLMLSKIKPFVPVGGCKVTKYNSDYKIKI